MIDRGSIPHPIRFEFDGIRLQIDWTENTEKMYFYFELAKSGDGGPDGPLLLDAEKYLDKEPNLLEGGDRKTREKQLEEIGISDMGQLEKAFISLIKKYFSDPEKPSS